MRTKNMETLVSTREVPNREQHAVVLACDGGYAMPLATALRSLVEANSRQAPLQVVILTSQFPESPQERVAASLPPDSAILHWIPLELSPFRHFRTKPYISKMTYARLLLPELVPAGISKALYMDGDVLVLNDLTELWHTDLEEAVLGAVSDSDGVAHSSRLWRGLTVAERGNNGSVPPYFNAGVLLIDVARWRQQHISEKAIDYMEQNPETLLADQDALNFACLGVWKQLASRWNFQDHYLRTSATMQADGRPGIIHFAGKWKPWDPCSLSPDAALYDDVRNRTVFGRTLLVRVSDAIKRAYVRLRRRLRNYSVLYGIYNRLKPKPHFTGGRMWLKFFYLAFPIIAGIRRSLRRWLDRFPSEH